MYLSLMRNIAKDKDMPPYFVGVDLSTEVVAPNPVFRLPVYWQRIDGRGSLRRGDQEDYLQTNLQR